MKGLASFIFSRVFVVNMLIAIVLFALLSLGLVYYLDSYTNHGEEITVRPLVGRSLQEVDELLSTNRLQYQIKDTSYSADLPPGAVLAQNPVAGSMVKENRTIYLTINNAEPPKVNLPDLKFKSIRVATAILGTKDLKIGNIEYRPSPDIQGKNQNYILEVLMEDDTLSAGEMIFKGSTVDLIVSSGMDGGETEAPLLIGQTLGEVIWLLSTYQLNVGSQVFEEDVEIGDTYQDTLKAVVYKQIPEPGTPYKVGAPVDVFLTLELADSIRDKYLLNDSLLNDIESDMPAMPDGLIDGQ